MPSNTVGSHGWLKIENGCMKGFYTDDEVRHTLGMQVNEDSETLNIIRGLVTK